MYFALEYIIAKRHKILLLVSIKESNPDYDHFHHLQKKKKNAHVQLDDWLSYFS